ncbi:methyltransferase family protein [Anaeromyxobacter oryzisoli]|uniref:methyltransferase family protein n=1 Tax=Anaeromyxobacter oryzisoli TaxID=2925408 RepID=UPI001F55C3DC|nr:isoprenylcysteine carboxylmethyltransferase family protein [Anaeromyxobacter sp. SG63]
MPVPWRDPPASTWRSLRRAFVDLALAALFLAFALAHAKQLLQTHRSSHAIVLLVELAFALFFLIRTPAVDTSRAPRDWLFALCGTSAPLLLRPTRAGADVLAGDGLQILGATGALLGILALNRSVGIVPARRALRSSGAYAVVRHPLYASYALSWLGYLVSNRSWANVAVVAIGLAFQLARVRAEERWLARDAAYRAYMSRTRWRLVPFVY